MSGNVGTRSRGLQEKADFLVRCEAIDRATPDWVRRCRALNHNVILLRAIRQQDHTYQIEWFCSCCGKDRK
jgi:hypothetical protein